MLKKERRRDVAEFFLFIILVCSVILSLWLYSGQPFPRSSPLAVVESGSMTHDQSFFGRIGTIDPGDIIIVKKSDIIRTRAEEEKSGGAKRYGDWGDVVVYYPNGDELATPIIHRVCCWVEVEDNRYTVDSLGIRNESEITIPELGLYRYRPNHDGFITKGDNNLFSDQSCSICYQPVKQEWIVGKARGELPWIGLLKLLIWGHPIYSPEGWIRIGKASAPLDQWICFFLFFSAIVGVSLYLDGFRRK